MCSPSPLGKLDMAVCVHGRVTIRWSKQQSCTYSNRLKLAFSKKSFKGYKSAVKNARKPYAIVSVHYISLYSLYYNTPIHNCIGTGINTIDNDISSVYRYKELYILTCTTCEWACKNQPSEHLKIADFFSTSLYYNLLILTNNTTMCLPLMQNIMGTLLQFIEMKYYLQN